MKKYLKPELEWLLFSVEDVILSSGIIGGNTGGNSGSTTPEDSEVGGQWTHPVGPPPKP